jgi:ribosomal protein S7
MAKKNLCSVLSLLTMQAASDKLLIVDCTWGAVVMPLLFIVASGQMAILTMNEYGLMDTAKPAVAERIIYGALEQMEKKTGKDPLELFTTAINNVKPMVEVKSRRVGGAMAITEAKRLVQAEKQEAAQLKQQAVREMERNKQVAADLAVMQLQVQTQAIAAQADVEQANRRTRNATATSQRRANKLAKLKTQS